MAVLTRAIGYAPLAPFAVAVSAAIVADRFLPVASTFWLVLSLAGALSWLCAFRRNDVLALAGLWVCAGGLGGAYHHGWRNNFPADDIGNLASVEPRLVRVRGTLDDEPSIRRHSKVDALFARPRADSTACVLAINEIEWGASWSPASGRARLTVEGAMTNVHVGDEVEVTGWLFEPAGPMNPGESDLASRLRDQRIRAELRVQHSSDGIVRLNPGSWGIRRALVGLRGWGERGLSNVDSSEAPVASALLLGDTNAMSADEWDRYVRTGVIHVLAISGQHLVILGAFLWFALRLLGVRRKPAAIIVAATLLTYALMTGGRPSAMRAAVIACAVCAGFLLRARPLPANTLALAWLVVLGINPTDIFTAGFQLSFLCVAVLFWGMPRWFPPRELTPLEALVEESRSLPERMLRGSLRLIGRAYLITLVLGIATAPLIAYWQNLVSPAGLVIGPPAILLTTIALISGFLLIILWPLGPLAAPLAWSAGLSLSMCDWLVDAAVRFPGGCWYVGSVPLWWVIGFYAIGGAWLLSNGLERIEIVRLRSRRAFPILLCIWIVAGLLTGLVRTDSDELRVTFVAVDHGGCTVIETPEGRVLLYDAGAISGPSVTRRQIAPFLWSRGIRRIDEVFLSHADLDHFNGLPTLLDRFSVGQITMTPTFADKSTPGVQSAIAAIERHGVAVRIARAGDRFTRGGLTLDVLHPPADGPEGVENVRSMVLLLQHRGHTILLTGDLESEGVEHLKTRSALAVDILQTPHHGSGAPAEALKGWVQPRLVVSAQGRTDAGKAEVVYSRQGIPYWATWPNGAITIRSHSTGLVAETFATGQRMVVQSGSAERTAR
jgi:competence protein ComEC